MSDPVGQKLYDAAEDGDAFEVSSLLRDHPDINVNWTDYNHRTALHAAGWNGHVEVVKLLLAHPDIDVNVRNRYGQTPFSIGCWYDQGSIIVRLLLKDPRVDVKLDDNEGCTLLRYASCNGRHEVIEWLIASGRDLGDVENKKGEHWDGKYYTALEIARKYEKTEAVSLLERFVANPAQTRHEVRVKLGVLDELAAEVFALTVFLCDDLLQLKPASPCCHSRSCCCYCHSLLCHCQETAYGAADDPLPSCCGLNEAEYSSQGFGDCLQSPCQNSSSVGLSFWFSSNQLFFFVCVFCASVLVEEFRTSSLSSFSSFSFFHFFFHFSFSFSFFHFFFHFFFHSSPFSPWILKTHIQLLFPLCSQPRSFSLLLQVLQVRESQQVSRFRLHLLPILSLGHRFNRRRSLQRLGSTQW